MKRFSEKLKIIFGYCIMLCLFAGGSTFFGYFAALLIGGELAAKLCACIYNDVIPWIVRLSTCTVLLGLLAMYCAGETALTSQSKKKEAASRK